MKLEMRKKDVVNNFNNIICIGYCDLAWLLRGSNRLGYTCGIYGWNADIYVVRENVCIVSGYRPFGNIQPGYELVRKYNEKARKICENWDTTWEYQKKRLEKLLNKFIDECLKEDK